MDIKLALSRFYMRIICRFIPKVLAVRYGHRLFNMAYSYRIRRGDYRG